MTTERVALPLLFAEAFVSIRLRCMAPLGSKVVIIYCVYFACYRDGPNIMNVISYTELKCAD